MGKDVFVGRSILKRLFKEFFIRIFDEGKDSRSFLSFRKQRDQEFLSPRIMLFYGAGGSGKTSMIRQCSNAADGIATELKRQIKIINIDIEKMQLVDGKSIASEKDLMQALFECFSDKETSLGSYFHSFKDIDERYKSVFARTDEIMKEFWPQESFENTGEIGIDHQARLQEWFKERISSADFEILENTESKLTDALIRGLIEASADLTILLVVDGYELLNPSLETWFRQNFLAKIFDHKNKIFAIISGDGNFTRNYRNFYPEEFIYPVCFNELPLSKRDISQIYSSDRISLSDSELDTIEQFSSGVPLAVSDFAGYLLQGRTVAEITADSTQQNDPVSEIVRRFFTLCDSTSKSKIYHLAMVNQFNPKVLAELWNISFSDISSNLNELSREFPFIQNKRLHGSVRMIVRENLMHEIAKGNESPMTEFFKEFSEVNLQIFNEQLEQLETAIASPQKRLNDERYRSALLNLFGNGLWFNPYQVFEKLPGIYLELVHYNPELLSTLLWKIREFYNYLPQDLSSIIDLLTEGVCCADSTLLRNRAPVNEQENASMEYLRAHSDSLTSFQNALLLHLNGEIEFRSGNLDNALNMFDQSFSLLNESSEKFILYEDYILTGYAFKGVDRSKLVSALSKALSIHSKSFKLWFDLGSSQLELGNYSSASQSFSEAATIDHKNSEVWYYLGYTLAILKENEEAVKAFSLAIELGVQKTTVFYELGVSLFKLERFEEAIRAFQKAIESEPHNAEALFLKGKAEVTFGSSNEAIESFRRAVEIKPDFREALIEMGNELYKCGLFEESADTLCKAADIDDDDAALWYRISSSYFKAEQYRKAIEAGTKALELKSNLSDALITIGLSAIALGEFEEAREALVKASKIDPGNVEIWNQIGNSYYSQNMFEKAIEYFSKAAELETTSAGIWFSIGLSCMKLDKYKEAEDAFECAVMNDPENVNYWCHKGEVHLILKKFDEAVTSYTKAVELSPDSHDAWYKRGLALSETGDHEKAIVSFVKAIELGNSGPDIWFNLGLSYSATGHIQEAVRAFSEASVLDSSRSDIWSKLGASKQALGLYDEAIEAYSKAAQISSDDYDLWYNLGLNYYYLSRYEEAIEAFTKAAPLSPDRTDALFHNALCCHALGKLEEASAIYDEVLKTDPDLQDAWLNQALIYHARNDYTKAIELYKTTVSRWPENGIAWYNMGLAYHAANDIPAAVKAYREAAKINPDQVDIWYNLAIAFHIQEHFGEAIQAYRKVVHLNPDNYEAYHNLGQAYYFWGHYQDAIDSYTKAVEIKPDFSTAWGNLAIAFFDSGKYDKAVESCAKALEIKPDEVWVLGYYIVAQLHSGQFADASQKAQELLATDSTGEEIKKTAIIIRKSLARNPALQGAQEILDALEEVQMSSL
jgi:putative PEP-CTERM system TPR-repeat lipoprotein